MQIFKINDNLQLVAESYSKSRNWGHKVTILYYGMERDTVKITYYNRTWERFQFESCLYKAVDAMDSEKHIPLADRIQAYNFIKSYR